MKVKIKKLHPDAVIPSYAKEGDAGMDLTAVSVERDVYSNFVYRTGIAIEIPKEYVGLLFPRSSISKKLQLFSNSVGVIDSGYRGEITMKLKDSTGIPSSQEKNIYLQNERIGQLIIIPYPQIEFEEVEELSETERGVGGYGSTGS